MKHSDPSATRTPDELLVSSAASLPIGGLSLADLTTQAKEAISSDEKLRALVNPIHRERPLPLTLEQLTERTAREAEQQIRQLALSHRGYFTDRAKTTALDINRIEIEGVSVTGFRHQIDHRRCQDNIHHERGAEGIIVTLSDGSSSASLSEIGSMITAKLTCDITQRLLAKERATIVSKEFLTDLYLNSYLALHNIVCELELPLEPAIHEIFGCTQASLIITPREAMLVGLSDGYSLWAGKEYSHTALTNRPRMLVESNCPPMLSSALYLDSFAAAKHEEREQRIVELDAEIKELNKIVSPQSEVDTDPNLKRLLGLVAESYKITEATKFSRLAHSEAVSLKIYHIDSASNALSSPIRIFSDGRADALSGADRHRFVFPLDQVAPRCSVTELGALVRLHNQAARHLAGARDEYIKQLKSMGVKIGHLQSGQVIYPMGDDFSVVEVRHN